MIKVENIVGPSPEQWEIIVKGIRNPMNSWDKSDSEMFYYLDYEEDPAWYSTDDESNNEYDWRGASELLDKAVSAKERYAFLVGDNDLKLMWNLANAGPDHGKFLRQLPVICEITAPIFWWLQFDQYKVGVTTNGTSKMHRLTEKEFTEDDFSIELYRPVNDYSTWDGGLECCQIGRINLLNDLREKYLETKDEYYWRKILEYLPESYNQKRTVSLNYAVLRNMYQQRKNHKLSEWHEFLEQMIESLPNAKELIVGE